MTGILEVAEVWSIGLPELGPAQPQLVFIIQDSGLSFYIIRCYKGILKCVCFKFCILQRIYKTRKFLVCPETFGFKLLVLFLVLVLVPLSPNFIFLILFRYSFGSNLGLPGFVPVPGNLLSFVAKLSHAPAPAGLSWY